MEIINEIGLQFVKTLTLCFGVIGIITFSLPFISRDLLLTVSKLFNRTYDIDTPINRVLNHLIPTETTTHRYRILLGFLLLSGSTYYLFVFFQSDITHVFSKIVELPKKWVLVGNILYITLILFSKLAGILGIISGVLLIFFPKQLKSIEHRVNKWFSTEPLEEKWNETTKDIDSIFFLHPLLLGAFGFLISLTLTILAFINLME